MSIEDGSEKHTNDGVIEPTEKSYKIYTREMDMNVSHNVIRFCSPRFDIHNLIAPFTLTRDIPKPTTENNAREKKKQSSSNVFEAKQQRESLDYSKLAPYGNAIKNRQNLFRKMTRTYQMSHSEASEAESRYKDKSLSKYPWKFSDFESLYHYVGTPEGNQDSTHVLLKPIKGPDNEDAFVIIPVKRWYRFIPQPWYRKAGEQKTEDIATYQRANVQPPPLTQSKDQGESSSGSEKERKTWKAKFLNVQQDTAPKKRGRKADDEDEELDYEEEFADDEEINLGIEDAEDQKEAIGRQFGKYSKNNNNRDDFGPEDDEMYSSRIRKSNSDNTFSNNLRRSLTYKEDESGDETFIFSDNEEYSTYNKYQGSKSDIAQNKVDKKLKQEDIRQSQPQKNKKYKKEPSQQQSFKKEGVQQTLKKKSLSSNNLDVPDNSDTSNNTDLKKLSQNEAPTIIRNISIPSTTSQSATDVIKMLSKNNTPTKPPDIKRINTSPIDSISFPKTSSKYYKDPPQSNTSKLQKISPVRDELQAMLSQQQSTPTETTSNNRPKKRFIAEEDVVKIYMKKGSFTIKAKELASELVLMCENNVKSKEHLKSLLNKMVKSENGMLHLMPEYRPK